MATRRDVWSGVNTRNNPMLRDHISHCRKRMREWTKKENQLSFELKGGVQCGKVDAIEQATGKKLR